MGDAVTGALVDCFGYDVGMAIDMCNFSWHNPKDTHLDAYRGDTYREPPPARVAQHGPAVHVVRVSRTGK